MKGRDRGLFPTVGFRGRTVSFLSHLDRHPTEPASLHVPNRRRILWTPVVATVLMLSCVRTDDPTGLGEARDLFLPIQPALIPSPADASARPVDRIRIWATRVSDGVTIGENEIDVDPNAEEWPVELTVSAPPDPGIDVRLWVLLLATVEGPEEVQFSGIAGPLNVSAGALVDSLDVPVLRGPFANHYVTSVTAEIWPETLAEGASAPLSAVVETTDSTSATVFWTALDSAIVSVQDTIVTGEAPGVGRVVASVGSLADTVAITVTPSPAEVVVTPASVTLDAPGLQTQLTAVVLDARGDTLPSDVVWTSSNTAVATSLGDGVFEGVAVGTASAIATSASAPGVSGSASLTVLEGTIPGTDVELTKTVSQPQPLADEVVTFTVAVTNLGGEDAGNVVVFDTIPTAPFTNIQHAVSVGSLDGDTLWTIPSLAVGDTATWTTTATVLAGAAGTSATNTALVQTVAANDTTPANDAASVVMNFPVSAIPVVQITSPADSSVFDPGVLVNFQATATDAEDGEITGDIVWVSSVDDTLAVGGSFERDNLSTGVHVITASATDSDGGVGAQVITITVALITTPPTLDVPFGGQASLPITLSEPARPGGVTLEVTSLDPGVVSPTTSTVFIAGGALSANATLDGVQPGTTEVTVSHPQFGASVTNVSVTAALNIVQNSLNVPETFPQTMDIRLESAGSPTAAPAGGIPVTLESRTASCVQVPSSVEIEAGLISVPVTASVGPSPSDIPCSSVVVATSAGIATDSITVTIQPAPGFSAASYLDLGAGLQDSAPIVYLGTGTHGGVTVRVESADPSSVLLGLNAGDAGTAFIESFVPNGTTFVNFFAMAVEGASGPVAITTSAPGFNSSVDTITVVQPAIEITSVLTATTAFAAEDLFVARIGTANAGNNFLSRVQAVRPGGDSVDITITSSDPAVGELRTATDSAATVVVRMPPGQGSTGSIATGGVAFFALQEGSTTLNASSPGFGQPETATRDIVVTTPGINPSGADVGSGLMVSAPWAVLGASTHGGRTVTISSRDPALALVSPDENTAGTASIDVAVADGQTIARYWVHGLEGVTGSTMLDVTAPGFAPDSAVVNVVEPTLDVASLLQTTTTFSPEDPFRVRIGRPNAQLTSLIAVQPVRAEGDTVVITLTSSDQAVADLLTLTDSSAPITLRLAPGESVTPASVATGGAALTQVGPGTVTISARAPGFVAVNNTDFGVTVTAPSLSHFDRRVGAGLQQENIWAQLSASDHPGVTVRIESLNPAVALIAPNDSTPGTAFIDVPVASGQTRANYVLQGVEGQAGDVPIVASAAGVVPDTVIVTVEPAAFDIIGLSTLQNTFSIDDPFQIRVGVPFSGGSSIQIQQSVRAGADTVRFTVSNSIASVAQLETESTAGQNVVVDIPPGEGRSGVSLATGGVGFDALGIGTTNVTASATGFTATDNGNIAVTVDAPAITVANQRVGAGLQLGLLSAFLQSTNHGGVTVTLTSSNPSVFLVSPNDSTPGTASIDIVVPDGQNRAYYYLQGVEGADASATLTATAAGFTNGVGTMTVVPPAVELASILASYAAGSTDDIAWAQVGVPNGNDTGLQQVQGIRAGSPGVTVTVQSSNAAAAQLLIDGSGGSSVQLTLGPGEFRTPTSIGTGGLTIDPLAAGTTVISASIPGFTPMVSASQTVTITP